MPNAMDFAARLILKESARKLLEDAETLLDDTIETEQEEKPEQVDDIETEEVETDNDEFQESLDDMIFFCANCNKHFIATKDTPDDMICCPVCNDRELIVNVGSAEQALENPENKEVAEELQDQEEKEEPEMEELTDEVEEEDLDFDESGLEESLGFLASNYSGLKECKVKIVGSYIKEGKMVINGRLNGKPFGMILEGLDPNKKSMILEGTCNMLPKCKVKVAAVLKGNVLKTGRLGYGLLHESKKIRGIVKR